LAWRIWQALTQSENERDDQFRSELERKSWEGLRVLGLALVLVPLTMTAAVQALMPDVRVRAGATGLMLAVAAMGFGVLALQRSGAFYDHIRPVSMAVIGAACCCLIWSMLLRAPEQGMFLYVILGQVSVAILLGLLTTPFRPIQVLLLGAFANVFFYGSYRLAIHWAMLPDDGAGMINILFLSMVTVLATGVSVSQYREFHERYLMHQVQLRAAEEMRDVQCRKLLSDNAASMGRLAAALSHELNNPLGIIKSNLYTIRTLLEGRPDLPAARLARATEMKQNLCRDSLESVERLESTVARMQRFTNLDRAEILPVEVNQLLRDVADVVSDATEERVRFEMDLQPAPDAHVRPQLMSAVFSALLQNAADASPDGASARVATAFDGESIRIRIEDRGKGMSAKEVAESMEPGFRVRGERVASCNWNLFGARQIVREHGGEIEIRSEPGRGTAIEVALPVRRVRT